MVKHFYILEANGIILSILLSRKGRLSWFKSTGKGLQKKKLVT